MEGTKVLVLVVLMFFAVEDKKFDVINIDLHVIYVFVYLHVTCGRYIKFESGYMICAKCFLIVFFYIYIVLLNNLTL